MQIITQFFAIVFAIFALSRAYLRFKERKLSSFAFIFWFFIWITGTLAIFLPDLTTKLARFLGIGRGVDIILYASIIIIFYLLFRIYIKIEDTQRQITQIARKIAFKNLSKNRKKTTRK